MEYTINQTGAFSGKSMVVFDLDGTLTPSKSTILPEMILAIGQLLRIKKVAIVSGGMFSQFQTQFLTSLSESITSRSVAEPTGDKNHFSILENLYLFPVNGSACYSFKNNEWSKVYEESLTEDEKERIIVSIKSAELETFGKILSDSHDDPHSDSNDKKYGEIIEDRRSEIAFSALGQTAPLELKAAWDPDRAKRQKMTAELKKLIPEFEVNIGGMSTIQVTRMGVNKAYAVKKIEEILHIPVSDMLFVGDSIYKDGNDYQALETGIDYIKVNGPEDTLKLIEEILLA